MGRFASARPWRTVAIASVVAAAALVASSWLPNHLSSALSDYSDPGSQSSAAENQIYTATGVDEEEGFVVLVRLDQPLSPIAPPPPRVSAVEGILRSEAGVVGVIDYSTTHDPAMISSDGRSTYVVGAVGHIDEKAVTADLQRRLAQTDDLAGHAILGGATATNVELANVSSHDVSIAESVAFPILLVLLLIVFRGVVAALLPLMCALLAILITLLLLTPVAAATPISVFALNLVSGLGLGLSIDFSLLIVSRFREELVRTGTTADALKRTLLTAGKTIGFSCVTVTAALASLFVFPLRYLRSMSLAGMFVTLSAAAVALLVLPAVLALLGPRVNALAPHRWRERSGQLSRFWYEFPKVVMARSIVLAAGVVVLLGVLSLPVLGIRFTGVDAYVDPVGQPARQVADAIARDFPSYHATPVSLLVDAPPDSQAAIASYAQAVNGVQGVTAVAPPRYLGHNIWRFDAFQNNEPLSASAQQTVQSIRGLPAPDPRYVFGATARFLDIEAALGSHLPIGLTLVVLTTFVVLFAMTGSVIMPVKALLMNALSLGAAFGVLVFVFQGAHFESLLGFTSQHAMESSTPLLILAVVFGLSTDYEVFLLSRIKEAYDGGSSNRDSVTVGLGRTGRIVTAAAAILFVALGALVLSRIVFIKELAVGAAVAVLLDATLVRAVLVPALMVWLGPLNWWAPRPLRALHERLGFGRIVLEQAPQP